LFAPLNTQWKEEVDRIWTFAREERRNEAGEAKREGMIGG